MQFYLKPVSGFKTFFLVLNSCGVPVYEIQGDFTPIGCRFYLLDGCRKEIARISGVRLSTTCQYSISSQGERVRLTLNVTAPRRAVKLRGIPWRFRGNVLLRSFDILDAQARIVMTHSRCWSVHGDCYAVDIPEPAHVPLCLCVAAIIDSTVLGGISVLAPV
jgi:uncharacterized protein YxjI